MSEAPQQTKTAQCSRDECYLDVLPCDEHCVLHSNNPDKDTKDFRVAAEQILGSARQNFDFVVFPTGEAEFGGFDFKKTASFSQATFQGDANFWEATFQGKANFWGATFQGDANFWVATFGGDANFSCATFEGKAKFWQATFESYADFSFATLQGKAKFSQATFESYADFSHATFEGKAKFWGATFDGEVDFWGATFQGDADFSHATFEGKAGFQEATFKDNITFVGTITEPLFSYDGDAVQVDFTGVTLTKPELLVFRHTDLRACRLLNTDVRKSEFTSVLWPTNKRKGVRVYDEVAPERRPNIAPRRGGENASGKRDWGSLERLYRQLKQNHEDQRDYTRGGNFHYREKEMRRYNPRTPPGLRFVLLPLYKVLGGYGERIGPPAWSLLTLVVLTTAFYLANTLRLDPVPAGEPINIGWFGDFMDWIRVAVFSLQVTFFKDPAGLQPYTVLGEVVRTIHSIIGPILLGLLALSIRQRVKR